MGGGCKPAAHRNNPTRGLEQSRGVQSGPQPAANHGKLWCVETRPPRANAASIEDKTAWRRVVNVGMELLTNPAAMQRCVDGLSSDMSGDEDPAMCAVKGMTAEILGEVKALSSNPRLAAIIQRDLRQMAEFV